jgi:hypothetical protein
LETPRAAIVPTLNRGVRRRNPNDRLTSSNPDVQFLRANVRKGIRLVRRVVGMTALCAHQTAGVDAHRTAEVDAWRSLMGKGQAPLWHRRLGMPAFSGCSFGIVKDDVRCRQRQGSPRISGPQAGRCRNTVATIAVSGAATMPHRAAAGRRAKARKPEDSRMRERATPTATRQRDGVDARTTVTLLAAHTSAAKWVPAILLAETRLAPLPPGRKGTGPGSAPAS